jgi:hypothetical protein
VLPLKYSKYASTTPAFPTPEILKKRCAESLSHQLPYIFKERNTKHYQYTVYQLITFLPVVATNVVAACRSCCFPTLYQREQWPQKYTNIYPARQCSNFGNMLVIGCREGVPRTDFSRWEIKPHTHFSIFQCPKFSGTLKTVLSSIPVREATPQA